MTGETRDILKLENVAYRWNGGADFSLFLPSFDLKTGERVLLLGESGSGKSTMLSLICGILTVDKGIVEVAGVNLGSLDGGQRDRFRAEHVGVIFQQFNLLPFGTVLDNILLPLRFAPHRRERAGNTNIAETAARLCTQLGLPGNLLRTRASNLSVGQQQRVAVARALIGHPPLIVADEPTSALDANSQNAFLDLLFEQTALHKTTLLMVSHDPRLAARFDRVVHMEEIADIMRDVA